METASSVMNYNPVFCTADTRVADVKYLLKKYDYDEILVLDSVEQKHPLGFVSLIDMDAPEFTESDLPSDVSAEECMRPVPAVVSKDSTLDECMNVMRSNHMERVPVVDINGHFAGMLERDVVTKIIM